MKTQSKNTVQYFQEVATGILMIVFCFMTLLSLGQSNLTVPAGEQVRYDDEVVTLLFKELNLEDNSAIILGPNVKSFSLTGLTTNIGEGVKILQEFPEANVGTNGTNGSGRGGHGSAGLKGQDGFNGADVTLHLIIDEMGTLVVDVSGADGGNGGNGGSGSRGNNASCKSKGTRGGNGGKAGDAGKGGDGGNVAIKFKFINPEKEQSILGEDQGITVVSDGGQAGVPGNPGGRGAGGKSHKKCGFYPYYSVGGGPNGSAGAAGATANNGSKGKMSLNMWN